MRVLHNTQFFDRTVIDPEPGWSVGVRKDETHTIAMRQGEMREISVNLAGIGRLDGSENTPEAWIGITHASYDDSDGVNHQIDCGSEPPESWPTVIVGVCTKFTVSMQVYHGRASFRIDMRTYGEKVPE
jgi:hypothetical protein